MKEGNKNCEKNTKIVKRVQKALAHTSENGDFMGVTCGILKCQNLGEGEANSGAFT